MMYGDGTTEALSGLYGVDRVKLAEQLDAVAWRHLVTVKGLQDAMWSLHRSGDGVSAAAAIMAATAHAADHGVGILDDNPRAALYRDAARLATEVPS